MGAGQGFGYFLSSFLRIGYIFIFLVSTVTFQQKLAKLDCDNYDVNEKKE